MKSYYIQLIRNGLTDGNVTGKYIGHIDEPLCTEGIKQIKEMKKEYIYPNVDTVLSSPLSRCTKTAELIYPGIKPIVIDGLIEYDFGEFEGKSAEELKNYPVFPDWLAGKEGVSPPFGETNEGFAKRIATSFIQIVDGLIKTGSTRAAIVTHGGVIMSLLSLFGLPEAPMHEWLTPGACGYTVRITPSLWSTGRKMEVIAEIPEIPKENGDEEQEYSIYDYDTEQNSEEKNQ